jgi:uncharacterized protein YwgA
VEKVEIRLKLLLDKLGISSDIKTVGDRKKVQKAVFLSQRAGVDFGYSYGWYLMGPYSPELTKDYFSLNEKMQSGEDEYEKYKLSTSLSEILGKIKPMMQVPNNVSLPQEDWLELVASIVYWNTNGRNMDQTKSLLEEPKAHLMPYFNIGVEKLKEYDLLT